MDGIPGGYDTNRRMGGIEHMSEQHAQAMTDVAELASLVPVTPQGTASRTVLKAEGVRLVVFAFDEGQGLSEHTAQAPVLLQALDGRLLVTAGGREVELGPGGVIHLSARLPHSVLALEPSRLLLTIVDHRVG